MEHFRRQRQQREELQLQRQQQQQTTDHGDGDLANPVDDTSRVSIDSVLDDGVGSLAGLEFLPGVVVQGHEWKLLITTYGEDGKTTLWTSKVFGSTSTTLETFQVVAGLRELLKWTVDTFEPWYTKNILV